ncbi:SIR2 family protein [Lacticaseibacillus saniviri]|uniref:SIR2 family protein n=1 Tax=Lacticaseibacillus saniviri TaxID=931533 RepID=UPI001EDFA63B|nr:SIR2 family protein [Lacticaseibacillus saniviri]MCG4282594.1 SIR2 family protein [Lacticaseibacillus saniviri]
MTLAQLAKSNRYPIVFIGSGISKRYLSNSPSWDDLLKTLWTEAEIDKDYYYFIDENNHDDTGATYNDNFFTAKTAAGNELEQVFHKKFFAGQLVIDGLTKETALFENLSPLKFRIAQLLQGYKLNSETEAELPLFRKFLSKAKMIVTTNYDTFIEDQLAQENGESPTVYIGENGFFNDTDGTAEIFKIHGSVNKPNSLVVTANDYQQYDETKLLISARLLVGLLHSPIIFLGYSLTDRNVVNLLSDFSAHFPGSDITEIANKIIVVDYDKNNRRLEETVRVREIPTSKDITYTSLRTENYAPIYEQISKIDEGVSPAEIRKYSGLIKRLIVDSENHGTLQDTLVALYPLDELESRIDNGQKIAIALGDRENFQVATLANYIEDYFSEHPKYRNKDALSFVASNSTNARTPFARIWNNTDHLPNSLSKSKVKKLNTMIKKNGTLQAIRNHTTKSYHTKLPEGFLLAEQDLSQKISRTADLIIWNIEAFNRSELKTFMMKTVLPRLLANIKTDASGNDRSYYRKLLMAYDVLINGDMTQKKPTD